MSIAVLLALLVAGCTDVGTAGASGDQERARRSEASASSPAVEPSTVADTGAATDTPSPEPSGTTASPKPSATPSTDTASGDATPKAREPQRKPSEQRDGTRLVAVSSDARGPKVTALQARLDEIGFAPGPVDGVFGDRTAAAVEAFQSLNDLPETGKADKRTVAAIADYDSAVAVLAVNDKGAAVTKLQRRLAKGPFDPGPADGVYGGKTVEAVWALEKLAGIPVDGKWGALDEHAFAQLDDGTIGRPSESHDQRWVEVDLSQQVLKVYDPGAGRPALVSHVSSGSGEPWSNETSSGNAVTPTGDYHITRRIDGWRESSLDIGRLYNPLYFNGGIAFHGAASVPLYPASHGCVRVPMHIAQYLPSELPNGTPVHVSQ